MQQLKLVLDFIEKSFPEEELILFAHSYTFDSLNLSDGRKVKEPL